MIHERLLTERERLCLSQAALAEKAGVTVRSQRNYEKGERLPDAGYMSVIAAAGLDVQYILTGQRDSAAQLAPDEAALLDHYRQLDPSARQILLATCNLFAGQPAATTGAGISVTGDGNRVAGNIYNENTKEK